MARGSVAGSLRISLPPGNLMDSESQHRGIKKESYLDADCCAAVVNQERGLRPPTLRCATLTPGVRAAHATKASRSGTGARCEGGGSRDRAERRSATAARQPAFTTSGTPCRGDLGAGCASWNAASFSNHANNSTGGSYAPEVHRLTWRSSRCRTAARPRPVQCSVASAARMRSAGVTEGVPDLRPK
jgi:hypothetical protein